jgi:ribosomally synthesized peptide (two-chain TOMM family)
MSDNNSPFSYDVFIECRAHIVRAIALAWQDPKFLEALISDPRQAMWERLGYMFPYPNIQVKVDKDNAQWRPDGFTDWVVTQDNSLELYLPPCPADPAQQALALASYNLTHLTPVCTTQK